ncbi:hypothetical protein [Fluviispira multicolorata]|uniref:Lipoprotein n=1 Tax=Fluviispira multicolorata TaxID=2654512 RepID=A0A833JFX6_9BACT|nr:hypothetical protein [Fluviispira multicolorata]KAB8031861.1 hypothetical protein GCL57_04245 [Fluviispira multicolorata]
MKKILSYFLCIFSILTLTSCGHIFTNIDKLEDIKHFYIVKEEKYVDKFDGLLDSNKHMLNSAVDISKCYRNNKRNCNYFIIGVNDEYDNIIVKENCLFCNNNKLKNESAYFNAVRDIDFNKKVQDIYVKIESNINIFQEKLILTLVKVDNRAEQELLLNVFSGKL